MDQKTIIKTVTSRDGTPIAYWRSGSGPPLVLVHGAVADHTRWAPLLPRLEQHFTVYAIDRRGRGQSGDSPDYALEREFEDVAAVVNSIGNHVNLLGHSFGGLCALEGALHTPHLRRLVLDEPVVRPEPGTLLSNEAYLQVSRLIEAGEREVALVRFLETIAKLSPRDIDMMRTLPSWPPRVAAVHTALREVRAGNDYRVDVARFKGLAVPTLFVLGGSTAPDYRENVDLLSNSMRHSRIAVISGQGHVSSLGAPDIWTREVVGFLTEGE